jgi:predicted MPP superfamily phosphohydrolase
LLIRLLLGAGVSAAAGKPLAASAGWREALGMLGVALAFTSLDGALLAALPVLGLSYGPVGASLAAITAVRLLVLLALLLFRSTWKLLTGWRSRSQRGPRRVSFGILALLTLNLGVLAAEVDGLYIEPFSLRLTQVHVSGPALIPGRPLRILHLSDLHVERTGPRERELLRMVAGLEPDLIVLTGDYTNIDYNADPVTLADTRALLASLSAPYGVYAIRGSPPVDTPEAMQAIFAGLDITLLEDGTHRLAFEGGELHILGVSNLGHSRDTAALKELVKSVPPGAYTLLLYHKPDLVEQADPLGVDLYLAGHTHGGQVCLPFYGALVTSSRFHKKYESGYYRLEHTILYVSRGIGMEGLGLPRARFFCPPEAVLITMGPESES